MQSLMHHYIFYSTIRKLLFRIREVKTDYVICNKAIHITLKVTISEIDPHIIKSLAFGSVIIYVAFSDEKKDINNNYF